MSGKKRTPLQALVRVGAAIIGLIALGSCLGFAQGSMAAISGIVRDSSGALMPGVGITAKQTDSGQVRTAVTDEYGSYNMKLLPVGPYEITADLPASSSRCGGVSI